ncbi:MAG: ABC transporter permease [Clostridia bacterium]|nr:ABC transporter permease [Clostridia bacterium]
MKEWLLAKSNMRKRKGTTIGLVFLIILASIFLNIMLIIFTDFNANAEKNADKLNTEDVLYVLHGDTSKIDNTYIESIINEDVEDYEIVEKIGLNLDTPYGDGKVSTLVMFENEESISNTRIGKTQIVKEDKTITDEYIYLPYQYHTGGKYNIGDNYEIKILDKTYNLKIKGFLNNIGSGSYNSGTIIFILDDATYDEFQNNYGNDLNLLNIKLKLKSGVDQTKFGNKFLSEIAKDNPELTIDFLTLETILFSRTYISVILGVSFLVVSFIILVIVFLMISNNISNYIKENMKTLGALKAVGYTNKNIKLGFLIQFLILSVVGSIIGIALSYLLLPSVVDIMVAQIGIPYIINFNILSTLITIVSLVGIIILTVIFFVRKTNKIKPITALREGIETHNFKKNRIELEKTKLPINISLALKTMFTNIKQNIATFVIVFFLVFAGIVALVFFQNFSVKPKISLLTFEVCAGAIGTDADTDKSVYNYIKNLDGVYNTREISTVNVETDSVKLLTYVMEDTDTLNNKDVCYQGRLPKYDNEIAISGKYCKTYNYNVGDEIEIRKGEIKEKFLISGYIQTTNNNGQEAVILNKGIEKIVGTDYDKLYYFDAKENVDVDEYIEKIKTEFGDRIVFNVNFEEVMNGSMSVFKVIANAMVMIIMIVCCIVILLVLYLLIKTLINNKKKDYGILKAMGYTSKNIIFQNAISFMPSIILSVISSCIISSFIVNPCLTLIMSMFGVMKLTFDIPVMLIIFMGIGFVVVSFIFALILSLKIKKIEPYKLLSGE